MNDIKVYELASKLKMATELLNQARTKVTFTWDEDKQLPLAFLQLCERITELTLDVSKTARKELGYDQKEENVRDTNSNNVQQTGGSTDNSPPELGCKG